VGLALQVLLEGPQELAKVEVAAKEAKKGLWADPKPVPPWEYRKMKKKKAR
jgi:micrococcal nuclease